MRYYNIVITNPANGQQVTPSSLGGLGLTSLLPTGGTNPAALQIELDLPVTVHAQPAGYAYVTVWGVSLQDIGSAADLNGMNISIYGGMQKGLPLANPNQSGLLLQGQIFQAFGNWIGVEQTINLIITAGGTGIGTTTDPKNIVMNWQAGQPMATAIGNTLSTAFPGVTQHISISQNLVLQHTESGYYNSLTEFAQVVERLSQAINTTADYPGVQIAYRGGTLSVWDGSAVPGAIQINPQDLIGQPTWYEPGVIQAKFVMRADLDVAGTPIILPPTIIQTQQGALTRFQDKSTFSGQYLITYMRHVGNFRQPDAASWNTTVNMTPVPKAAAATPAPSGGATGGGLG